MLSIANISLLWEWIFISSSLLILICDSKLVFLFSVILFVFSLKCACYSNISGSTLEFTLNGVFPSILLSLRDLGRIKFLMINRSLGLMSSGLRVSTYCLLKASFVFEEAYRHGGLTFTFNVSYFGLWWGSSFTWIFSDLIMVSDFFLPKVDDVFSCRVTLDLIKGRKLSFKVKFGLEENALSDYFWSLSEWINSSKSCFMAAKSSLYTEREGFI